ncbi:MAG: ribonuclease [Rhizobium sp.]|nr:ribonuclease [Rhizobium sp.]
MNGPDGEVDNDSGKRGHDERGRHADTPTAIPPKGLRDVFWRVVSEVIEDRVSLIAAGVTYYLLFASFPALGVLVALYGFMADPSTIATEINFLSSILPPGALDIVLAQLTTLTAQKTSTLSFAFVTSFLIALWSANNGIKALFDAMNIAYGETEKRSIIKLNLMSLAFTAAGLLVAAAVIFAIGIVPAALAYLRLENWIETLAAWARWPIILIFIGTGIVMIYRYGPSRENARLRWISWGAAFSTLIWLLASMLFSFYLANFADYNATYGTLGALIGFMVWIWISVIIVIVGAEINAELEHQTMCDSTTGPPVPMGDRGAVMADTLGRTADGS